MEEQIRILSAAEVERVANVIEGVDADSLDAFQSALLEFHKVVRDDGDSRLAAWVWFAARLFAVPLAAMESLGVQANALWVDPRNLSSAQTALIKGLADRVSREAAKARFCDYVWLADSDHLFARRAVAAYMELAKTHVDPEEWIEGAAYFGRALRLSARLGRGALFDEVTAVVDGVIRQLNAEDSRFLTTELMQAVLDTRGRVDADFYATLAEKAARRAEDTDGADRSRFHLARVRWLMAAEWHRVRGNSAAETRVRAAFGETFIAEAELLANSSPAQDGDAASLYSQGIHCLRRLQGQRDRVSSLLARLKELQQLSIGELKPIGGVHNFSECVAAARRHVSGRPLGDAVLALATLLPIPSVDKLRASVLESAKVFISQQIFATVLVNDDGAPIAGYGTLDPNSPEDHRLAIESRMNEDLRRARICDVFGFIEPARAQLVQEHVITPQVFLELAAMSEFIPASRESLWARGLHAGMVGDFLTSTHVLVPQVEHSIRALLQRSGKTPVSWTKDGYEEAPDLNAVLRDEETEKILGKDLLFTLSAVLVNKIGGNFRNRLAHGLIETEEFFGDASIYTWWLLLKCVAIFAKSNLPPVARSVGEEEDTIERPDPSTHKEV
jgi:hypothetical protein